MYAVLLIGTFGTVMLHTSMGTKVTRSVERCGAVGAPTGLYLVHCELTNYTCAILERTSSQAMWPKTTGLATSQKWCLHTGLLPEQVHVYLTATSWGPEGEGGASFFEHGGIPLLLLY